MATVVAFAGDHWVVVDESHAEVLAALIAAEGDLVTGTNADDGEPLTFRASAVRTFRNKEIPSREEREAAARAILEEATRRDLDLDAV